MFSLDKSCTNTTRFRLAYSFAEYNDVLISILIRDNLYSTQTSLLSSFAVSVISPGCTQNEDKPYQCYTRPTSQQLADREFEYVCAEESSACSLIGTDRCSSNESYCWGYGEYRPSCTNALSNELACSCIHYSCITGQCYRENGLYWMGLGSDILVVRLIPIVRKANRCVWTITVLQTVLCVLIPLLVPPPLCYAEI